jgi:hypothetical protein
MAGLTRIKSDGIGDNCDFDGEGTLVLDSTNNRVGIGTSSPGGNLTVTDASTYTVDVKANGSNGALLTTLGGSASLALGTDSAERLRIDSVGNVSIGISTFTLPSGKGLQVYDSTTPRFKLANSTTGTGSGDGSLLYVSGNDFLIENKESANMRFYTSASERMRIDSAGRIGIASGSQDLSVFNANGAQDLVVYAKGSSGTNQHAGITLKAGSTSGQCSVTFADGTTGDNRYRGAIDYFHSNDSMGFRTGSVANRILITSDGRVCMGTTSATASRNLTLTGLTNDAGIQITGTTSGGNCYITNTPGSSGQTYIGNTNSQNLNFVVGGNVSTKATIDSSGNLQVSTGQFTVGTTASTGLQFINDGTFGTINSIPLVFRTVSAERMRLANSGELLLGTTTAPARGELLKVEKKSAGTEGAGIKLSGTYSLPDDGSQTFTVGNCALIFIAENNTGDGAMFFCTYKASAVSKVSDPHDRYANSDTDGKICVYKTAESQSVVLKNRCGATKSFTIGKINTSD